MIHVESSEATSIIFAPGVTNNLGEDLRRDINRSLPYEKIALCETINKLAFYLLPQRSIRASKQIITVLLITDTNDMRDIIEFSDLLSQFTLIMGLNDNYGGLINVAKKLNPHLTTFLHDLRQDSKPLVKNFIKLRKQL